MNRAVFNAVAIGAILPAIGLRLQTETACVAQAPAEPDRQPEIERVCGELPGLDRVIRIGDRIYSGIEPPGEAAFAQLAELGVRAIVCVDAARPQVEMARRHGLRYIHIPIGYDRITDDAGGAITRVIREVEGPIYIHCHHGRHRGPAAAAIACIADGVADGRGALQVLEAAGASREYPGLWRDVAAFRPPPSDAKLPELVEVASVESFTAGMAQIDRVWDSLELCRDAGWASPAEHPDVVADREALILRQSFQAMLTDDAIGHQEDFRQWLENATQLAGHLHTALAADDTEEATRRFERLQSRCDQCHAKYRDR